MIIPPEWINDKTYYSPEDIDTLCNKVKSVCTFTGEGKIKYLNFPVSFDTETTSFIDSNGEKTAIVYVWMLSLGGLTIVGRTFDQWMYVYRRLCWNFRTCGKRIIIIYVHSLNFDFQFIRKYHEFSKVFAIDTYDPLYATTIDGIQFRCSYKLSGYSLAKVGENLNYHKVNKLVGDLDYRQIRHSETPLTETEIQYCINDCKVVCAYIDELIDREGGIDKLPLTKTGFVRNYCRAECFKDYNYKNFIHNMTLSPADFDLCKNAFQGGFTHSNPEKTNEIINDVTSLDIISSYPSVMVTEKFPIESPTHINIENFEQFQHYNNNYCTIFKIQFINIRPRHFYDFYISGSKCTIEGKRQLSNGRIVYADSIITTITNVDFDIIDYMYKYDDIYIIDFMYFKRDYLPTAFIKALLNQYQKKTELKGVEGKEIEYAVSKENQNSFYGMTVTSPIRPEYIYENEWLTPIQPDIETALEKYNNAYNRFLFYPWGVYVTAYARRNIWSAIIQCGNDHIYSDTDSEKLINYEKHKPWFDDYNYRIKIKLQNACKVHNIPFSMCNPKTKDGKYKLLGAFEIDGIYNKFKTLGAKRYLYTNGFEIERNKFKTIGVKRNLYKTGKKYGLVVAGLSKKGGLKYLLNQYRDNIFDHFKNGMSIPKDFSGRLVHTYIDDIREGDIIDMYGNKAHYKSLSGVHLDPAPYTVSDISEFLRFINSIKEGEYI